MKKKSITDQPVVVTQKWDMFVKAVLAHIDPVLASILLATQFLSFDQGQKVVRVATLKKFILFQDLFIEQKKIYQEYLDRIFGFQVLLVVEFSRIDDRKRPDLQNAVSNVVALGLPLPAATSLSNGSENRSGQSVFSKREKSLDVSDIKKWTITSALLEHFGGSVKEIIKDTTHELDT